MSEAPRVRILIVDDEVPQMKALCDTLRDHDYDTVGFTAGAPALEALRSARFDLLLADLMMPGMDGIALLKSALEADPDLVGIIMTGEGTISTAVEAMKSGALDYILKPFRLSVILPVLSRALAMRRLRMENAELQQRLRERAAELETANKELESFTSSVSHDLRAPLRAIDGFSRMLGDDYGQKLDKEGRRLIEVISDNARKMSQLIEDLLEFSRLGRRSLAVAHVDSGELVVEVIETLRRQADASWPAVTVDALPGVRGDRALLRQVWVNLVSNAIKFSSKVPAPAVRISSRAEGSQAVFAVVDNGAGFDMRYYDKLFAVFQRLHSADQFQGTGVGLAIVQRIVDRHGGRVWAESTLGEGAAFYFSLPLSGRESGS